MNLEPSLNLLEAFTATRAGMDDLSEDPEFALWLELRPRLIEDTLDGCLYLAASSLLRPPASSDLRRALLRWVTGTSRDGLQGLAAYDDLVGLDLALAAFLSAGTWRAQVQGLVALDQRPPQPLPTNHSAAPSGRDRDLPRSWAEAERHGSSPQAQVALLVSALDSLGLDGEFTSQVRSALERRSAIPIIAWPLDLVVKLDVALCDAAARIAGQRRM